MAYTTAFKTKSEIVPCTNLRADGIYPVALDIGYSSVKGMAPFCRFCFPSYVKEHSGNLVGTPQRGDILYRNEAGEIYAVGSLAQDSVSARDTNDASNTLFGRNRYNTPAFLILARVGLGIAMKHNGMGGFGKEDRLFLQTGLPPAYRKADTPILTEVLSGRHVFSIRLGAGKWVDFDFTLAPDNIHVIDQPIGSVFSATKRSNGKTVEASNGKTYIDSRTLVLDGGFGTLDIYSISNRSIDGSNTFNDLGMKAIFERTAADIFQQYGKEVYAHTLQPFLETGRISVLDRKTKASAEHDISPILERNTALVCDLAMTKVENTYNNLEDYDYLIVTGGTGTAWLPHLKQRYQRMETLEIVCANQNEPISPIYSNVRGYYIFRAMSGAGK